MEWKTSTALVDYLQAVELMENRVDLIHQQKAEELIWLLEHPAIYTGGSSAESSELSNPANLPVYQTGRGGKYTYHGPGQRVAYLMLNLKNREQDVRLYVQKLERLVIAILAEIGVEAKTKEGMIGIWVCSPNGQDAKIAAIGIRLRKWITYHGFAINLNPNLEYFTGIIPCGISNFGVTSLSQLGINISTEQLDQLIKDKFNDFF